MVKGHKKIELNAQLRQIKGRQVKQLRASGVMPAVLYGKGQEPLDLQVLVKDFEKTLKQAGESTLVYVQVDGKSYPTLIHDVVREPVRDGILHADFYKVRLDEKIKTNVPVVFEGESPAVKADGGIFVRNVNELEVEALPQDLPHELKVDISVLAKFGDQILAKDVKVPANVKLIAGDDEIIATVQEPISEEELKASLEAPTTDVTAVEEIKKEEKPAEEAQESAEAQAEPAPQAK